MPQTARARLASSGLSNTCPASGSNRPLTTAHQERPGRGPARGPDLRPGLGPGPGSGGSLWLELGPGSDELETSNQEEGDFHPVRDTICDILSFSCSWAAAIAAELPASTALSISCFAAQTVTPVPIVSIVSPSVAIDGLVQRLRELGFPAGCVAPFRRLAPPSRKGFQGYRQSRDHRKTAQRSPLPRAG